MADKGKHFPLVADRVNHIADLMSEGKWQTRVTIRRLAKEWNINEGTLKNDASEAARLLAVPEEERTARRAVMAAWFEEQAKAALARTSKVTGLPDLPAALKAMELYGRYSGLELTDEETKKLGTQSLTVRLLVEGADGVVTEEKKG